MSDRELYEQRIDAYTLDDCIEWCENQTRGQWRSTGEPVIKEPCAKIIQFLEELKLRRDFAEEQRKNKQADELLTVLCNDLDRTKVKKTIQNLKQDGYL